MKSKLPRPDEDHDGSWFDSLTPMEEFLFDHGYNPRRPPLTPTATAPEETGDPARRLSLAEAAERLGVSKKTVARLVRERRLRCVHVGRRLTFRSEDLSAFKGAPSRPTDWSKARTGVPIRGRVYLPIPNSKGGPR